MRDPLTSNFGSRFASNWVSWALWIVALGVGYHGTQFIVLTLHGMFAEGAVILITGIIGYLIVGAALGVVIGLPTAALAALSIKGRSVGVGVLTAVAAGVLFGVLDANSGTVKYMLSHASPSLPSPAGLSTAADDRTTCLQYYAMRSYSNGLSPCKSAALQYVSRLQGMARSGDANAILNNSWDMLRFTYVMAFAYKENSEPENAHQMALHSVGWGIYALGAIEQVDPQHSNPEHVAMESEIGRDLLALDAAFPGVLAEERRAIQETSH